MIQTLHNFAAQISETKIDPGDLPKASASSDQVAIILSTVFGFIGAMALLVIVVSGFRYITSGGESDKIAKAKNGIIYALVGLVIAISAQAFVTFVVRRID